MGNVTVRDVGGRAYDIPEEQLPGYLHSGFTVEGGSQRAERNVDAAMEDEYGGTSGALAAGTLGALGTVTGGASDALLSSAGAGDALRQLRERHPVTSALGSVAGAFTPVGLGGIAGKAGAEVTEGLGGGLLARVAGGATEGSLYGAGQGVTDLALSRDPLTWERAASTLGSNVLFGAGAGGLASGVTGLVSKGLEKANTALNEHIAARASRDAVAPELEGMSAKELNAARTDELTRIDTERAPLRQELVDDLKQFRLATRDEKLFLATKDADVKGIGEVKQMAKVTLDADRQLDRLLNNPIKLAENPKPTLGVLQQQEHALTNILKSEPELRAAFAADETGARAAALDAIAPTIERNRAFQARIRELTAEPMSDRLKAIADAKEALSAPAPPKSMAEQALSGTAFGAITGAIHAVPVLGQLPGVAHWIGAKGAELAANLVFGRMSKAVGELATRTSNAAKAFAGATELATKYAPVVATKVLEGVRYGPSTGPPQEGKQTLPELFKARTDEIKQLTAYDETGTPRIRPEARQALADQLRPIRLINSILGDRLETLATRRLEYLSSIIPRRPDYGGIQSGPDTWHPSDMAMRSFARSVAAVENPTAVEERLLHGAVTPEEAKAYWAVYPERARDFQMLLLQHVSTLQKTLPYTRRIALGIFTRTPIDPSMNPRVLTTLQNQFTAEPGSSGGTAAPKAQPQFGSLKKSPDAPTPAQTRAQGHV
jgi:hypothetical protein